MADYHSLLTRAVANLPSGGTPATREAIYDRARKALIEQLRSLRPPLPESDIAREANALDAAIAQIEAKYGPQQAPLRPPLPRPLAAAGRRAAASAETRRAARGPSTRTATFQRPLAPAAPAERAGRRVIRLCSPRARLGRRPKPGRRARPGRRRARLVSRPRRSRRLSPPPRTQPAFERAARPGGACRESRPPCRRWSRPSRRPAGLSPPSPSAKPPSFPAGTKDAGPVTPVEGDARRQGRQFPAAARSCQGGSVDQGGRGARLRSAAGRRDPP